MPCGSFCIIQTVEKKIGYGEFEKTLIGLGYLKMNNRLPELFIFRLYHEWHPKGNCPPVSF